MSAVVILMQGCGGSSHVPFDPPARDLAFCFRAHAEGQAQAGEGGEEGRRGLPTTRGGERERARRVGRELGGELRGESERGVGSLSWPHHE